MRHPVFQRLALLPACLLAAFVSISATSSVHEHSSSASRPRVDVLDDGKVVVSLDLAGDLPGTVTFTFERNGDGTVTGQWAMVVGYADTTDPETGEEPSEHNHADPEHAAEEDGTPHKDFLRLVNRGAMGGAIESGTLTFDATGALAAMAAVLSIGQGTLEFEGAAGGTGTATLSQLTLAFQGGDHE